MFREFGLDGGRGQCHRHLAIYPEYISDRPALFPTRKFTMTSSYRRLGAYISALLLIAITVPLSSLGANGRLITEMDLFKFVWIADPQISPDGSRVAYVRVWVNQKSDRYDTAIWVVSTGGGQPRQITTGPRDPGPRWSPDGRTLAFTRSAKKDGRPQPPQIYLMTFDGGEAQPLTG